MKAGFDKHGKLVIYPEPGDPPGLLEWWYVRFRRVQRTVNGTRSTNTDAWRDAEAVAELRQAIEVSRDKRKAECREYADAFALSAARLRKREIGFLDLAKEITGSDRMRAVERLKDGVREFHPELADLLPKSRGYPKGVKLSKPRKERPFDPGPQFS